MTPIYTLRRTALAAAVSLLALPVTAATLEITVTNTQSTGQFSLTPLWVAFHDGSFDAFDTGTAASGAVESLAELGNPAGLDVELAATDPAGVSGSIAAAGNGVPTIDPGETATATFNVDPGSALYFSFLAMLLPSNDSFIANDDPLAVQLFDAVGTWLGDKVLTLTAADLYDAGTEINDPTNGAAFLVGQTATDGADENGLIHAVESFDDFAGLATPLGPLAAVLPDLVSDPGAVPIATITISEVAPVPLPAGGVLALSGLAALGMARMRRKAA